MSLKVDQSLNVSRIILATTTSFVAFMFVLVAAVLLLICVARTCYYRHYHKPEKSSSRVEPVYADIFEVEVKRSESLDMQVNSAYASVW